MHGHATRARRFGRRAATWTVSILLAGGVCAQSSLEPEKPVGFSAGPFILAPSLTMGYGYDNNLFLAPSDPPSATADGVLTVQPAVMLTLPFSNSTFRLGDTYLWRDYRNTAQDSGKGANDAVGDLTLRFASFDELQLSAHHINGVAETLAFDPGRAVTFHGNGYRLHTEGVSIAREVPEARGYRVSVVRNALKFDPGETVVFFNYRGFDGEGAYLQPLSPNTRIAFGYLGTRYDHFNTDAPSVVDRTESGDTIYAQIEGRLGPRQPYSARLGWEELNFEGNSAKDFKGLIGQAQISAIVGGGTMLVLRAQRQPYRAFYDTNNYYVYDVIGAQVRRDFPQGSSVGGNFDFFRNSYGEPGSPGSPDEGIYRRDRAMRLEAYGNLIFRGQVALRLSIVKNRRYSNVPAGDYDGLAVFGGFVFGWI